MRGQQEADDLGNAARHPRRSLRNPTTGLTSTRPAPPSLDVSGRDLRDRRGRGQSAARAAVSRAWRASRRTTTRCRASLRAARGLASAESRGIRSSRPRKLTVNKPWGPAVGSRRKRRGTGQIGRGAVSRQRAQGRVGPAPEQFERCRQFRVRTSSGSAAEGPLSVPRGRRSLMTCSLGPKTASTRSRSGDPTAASPSTRVWEVRTAAMPCPLSLLADLAGAAVGDPCAESGSECRTAPTQGMRRGSPGIVAG